MTTAGNPKTVGHPQTAERHRLFGQRVRALRQQRGLSQEALAALVGCNRQTVNRIENVTYTTSLHQLFLLADALGVTAADLLAEPTPDDDQPGGTP
jgi:transcriptional regulator with XRE-family HTH domain